MLCSRLIQTSPVASWIHKHFLTSYGRHTAAWQANLLIDWLLGATDQDGRNLSTFLSFQLVFCLVWFPRQCKSRHWVRWELKQSFNSQLCQEYVCQKSLKSDNHASSYGQYCCGCFFFQVFFYIFQLIFRLVFFPDVVEKQTLGEVKN